jgi:hypothetical protein
LSPAAEPVRVEVRDDPEIDVAPNVLERTRDRDTRALVPVDATEHEHTYRPRIPDA